jgi:hypothetical protein
MAGDQVTAHFMATLQMQERERQMQVLQAQQAYLQQLISSQIAQLQATGVSPAMMSAQLGAIPGLTTSAPVASVVPAARDAGVTVKSEKAVKKAE